MSNTGTDRVLQPASNAGSQETVTVQRSQEEVFDAAMTAFHARDFAHAKELLEKTLEGPNQDIARSARIHIRMCEQRLEKARTEPQTPEEHYHFAVGLINQRRLADAEKHVRKALEANPKADHYHYAMALCRGLQGDLGQAARELQTAIELDSRNRGIARNDADFMEFGRHSPVRELIFVERSEGD